MHGLTVWQPWAFALACGAKPVENRTWPPPARALGQQIAIHAGKEIDRGGIDAFKEIARHPAVKPLLPKGLTLAVMPRSAIVSVGELVGALQVEGGLAGAVVGELSAADRERILASPWTCGPWAWLFAEMRRLAHPVPCRGAQGLWVLPPELERRVLAEIRRVTLICP